MSRSLTSQRKYILYTHNVQVRSTSQQPRNDSTIKIFVRQKLQHNLLLHQYMSTVLSKGPLPSQNSLSESLIVGLGLDFAAKSFGFL